MHHSKSKYSVISGQLANPDSQKTVLSGKRKGSIKQSNASQVLVSETVPARRVQPSREAKNDQVSRQPCEQHCASTTKKAART